MKTLLFATMMSLGISTASWAQGRTMSIQHLPNGPSYFNVTVNDSGLLNGSYPGWCADWTTRIEDNTTYNTTFHSSLSPSIPSDVIDHPENLDEVNWLINQNFVGKTAPNNLGVYTFGDVQLAIWSLLDDQYDPGSVGEHSMARVELIVSRSKIEGANYHPKCRELVGIILVPTDPTTGSKSQNTIIVVPRYHFPKCAVPDSDETL